MKKFLFVAIFFWIEFSLTAQQTPLFSYDREKVNLIMDQINESNTSENWFLTQNPEKTNPGGLSNEGTFFIGFGSGCSGSIVGSLLCNAGLFLKRPYLMLIGGGLAGTALAVLIVSGKEKAKSTNIRAAIGGVSAIAVLVAIDLVFTNLMIFDDPRS